MEIREFLARHLNDHEESARGVRQGTFFTWSEAHVREAVDVALSLVYSLIPDTFSRVETVDVKDEDCVFEFCDVCEKFMGIVDVEIEGEKCIKMDKKGEKARSLIRMLRIGCTDDLEKEEEEDKVKDKNYTWEFVHNTTCVVKFENPLPKGSKIRYICSRKPSEEDLNKKAFEEYLPIIAEYSAYWLYRTDSESRSNLQRADLHRQTFENLIQVKLGLEVDVRNNEHVWGLRQAQDDLHSQRMGGPGRSTRIGSVT